MEKEKDLKNVLEKMRANNDALMLEIGSLKRQIGGLKTSNTNYRNQIARLKERIEHYKNLDIEGDGLYEQKVAECEKLRKRINEMKKPWWKRVF